MQVKKTKILEFQIHSGEYYNDEGTPQGGIISPMLSNIYLHEALDNWYAKVVKPRLRGRSLIIRFADDAILGFESKKEAEKVLPALTRRFERYGPELHQEKTRLVYFDNPGKHTEHTEKDSDKDDDEGNKNGPEIVSETKRPLCILRNHRKYARNATLP